MNLVQDLRYASRLLRKNPGFAVAAVIVLALGIGANTAIFSIVNAVLLRPLPYKDADRLVQIWHVPPAKSFPGLTRFSVSAANYIDWEKENQVFEQMAIYTFAHFDLTSGDQPQNIEGAAVSPDFFSVLRSQPIWGRVFLPEENQPGRGHVAVLSYALWKERFGGNPAIVGQNMAIDGQSYTVVGIMGPEFRKPDWAKIWTPLAWTDKERAVRGEHHYLVIARLQPTVRVEQAQAEMATISGRLEQEYPEDDKGWGAVVVPLREDMVGDVRGALLILLGAVTFVLLIACANVANLTLAKTFARQKEIAIRSALGASRGHVVQQVLAETLVLSVTGGGLGLLFANGATTMIRKFLADSLPRSAEVRVDVWVLVFTLGVSLAAGVAAGLAPALRLTQSGLNESLKLGGGRSESDSGGNRLRSVLVVSEVALSLVLLVGAGLMIRSLWLLRSSNPGWDSSNVVTLTVAVPHTKFETPSEEVQFFDGVLGRVRALPGVDSAGVIDSLPLSGGSHQPIAIEGRPQVPMSEQPEVDVRLISPGYFRALHVPLRKGRDVNASDTADRPAVIVISETMARRFWPNEDPIGKHLTLTFFPDKVREVVGIVGDVKLDQLDTDTASAVLYFPLRQISIPPLGGYRSFPMSLVVRAVPRATSLVRAISSAVHEIDPQTPVTDIASMDDVISNSLSQRRFNMLLLAAFAGLAVLLAAVGIYSVLAYAVRRRVREIGIRMALGARTSDVLRMILAEGMTPTAIGMGLGLAGALALGRVLSTLVYGLRPSDPLTLAGVSLLLAGIAVLASLIPAYRATKVVPIRALRDE